jgi:MFS family permease
MTAPPALTSRPRAARVATWTYFVLNGFALGMWVVHIPVIERVTGVSHATLGGLLLVLGASAFAGMQVAGPLVDRFGHRVVVPAAAVLLGVSLIGPGLARNWWSLAIALAFFGFGNGSIDVAMNAHAVAVERAYARPIMAAFHAMFSIGGAGASVVGAMVLGADLPPSTTLTVCAVVCVVAALVASRFLIATPVPAVGPGEEPGKPVRRPAQLRLVWLLGGLAFALFLAEGVANDWAALQLKDALGTSASTAALAYGAFSVTMTAGRFAADRVTLLVGPAAVVRYGAALAGLGLAVASVSPWVVLAIVGWAVFGLGLSGCIPQLFSAAGNLDTRASGALMARVVGLGYVGLLAGPAVIGGLTHWMPLNVTFILPIALCVIASLGASVLEPRGEPEPLEAAASRAEG